MAEISQWEYRLETFGTFWSAPKDDELQAALDAWGEEGWEVVGFGHMENSNKIRVLAKRPSTSASRRRRSWPGG